MLDRDGCFEERVGEEAKDVRTRFWRQEVCAEVGDRAAGVAEEEGGGEAGGARKNY